MTEVEAVARALCRFDANRDGIWFDDAALKKHIDNHWRSFRQQAQAALTAMNLDAMREAKAAFTAGWLAANNRRDVPPEEAWLTYLDCKEAAAPKEQRHG